MYAYTGTMNYAKIHGFSNLYMSRTENTKSDQLLVPESVLAGRNKEESLSEKDLSDYQSALEQIQKRVDAKSYFNVNLSPYLKNTQLIACLSKAVHHDIYGRSIRILLELLNFLAPRIENAPSLLNKISKLKNFYGEDHYKFKNLINFMQIAANANTIVDLYTQAGTEKEAQKSASRAKTDIGVVINRLAKDINRQDRKNKRRGKGLDHFDLADYRQQVLEALGQYLNIKGLSEKELLKLMDEMLKQKDPDFLPEQVIAAQVKAGIKGIGDLI